MNPQYLFRGKKISDKSWIEGSLILWPNGRAEIAVHGAKPGSLVKYAIIPETVGIYIGIKGYKGEYDLRKQNEVKLFSGDIVEARSEGAKGTFVITYRRQSSPGFYLMPAWQWGKFWNIHGSDVGREKGDYFDDLKVIGNIHDTPELLKQ